MAKSCKECIAAVAFAVLAVAILPSHATPAISPRSKDNGTITHEADGSQVWCQPTHWYDILWFFFANFILHALSVRSLPGENAFSSTVFKFCCLLIPYTGVRRGLCLIYRAGNLANNDLQAAARANALCMVIRAPDWRPRDGQIVEGCTFEESPKKPAKSCWGWTSLLKRKSKRNLQNHVSVLDLDEKAVVEDISPVGSATSNSVQPHQIVNGSEVMLKTKDLYTPPPPPNTIGKFTRFLIETYRFRSLPPTVNKVDHLNVKIHGVCQLAPGYALSYIPEDVKIYSHIKHLRSLSISRLLGLTHAPQIKLASTHDVPRILFSIIQTASGAYALYKARGSQIDRYGYAAFGLTVLPYMMVSIINLIGSLLTNEYETLYLVHSATMDEMKVRGGLCDGVVGTLERPDHQQFIYVEGENETKPEGHNIHFTMAGGEAICHEIDAPPPAKRELQISTSNHIDPVKEEWPSSRSLKSWRRSKKHEREEASTTPLLRVPSHSSFTRLSPPWYQTSINAFTLVLVILALGVPHMIIALLSGYKINRSTAVQRTFVLNWLICGQLQGYGVSLVEAVNGKSNVVTSFLIIFATYGSYCVMGLYVVAQEMIEFGTCKAL
ncbi:MAG: hypothetical protein Q9220_000108 [cf. Caloplaca sp. 1 TL-2023]